MNADKLRVVFLGSGQLGFSLYGALKASPNCNLVGVIPWSSSLGRITSDRYEQALVSHADREGVHIELGCGANDPAFALLLERLNAHCVLVGAWGEILKHPLLQRKDCHFINCHPSLLPAHRGPNPYCSVIRQGETKTGVTFHLIDEHIDSGPVILQNTITVTPEQTGGELRARCANEAASMIERLMVILNTPGPIRATAQALLGESSYYPALRQSDALIPWAGDVTKVQDHIRSLNPWRLPFTFVQTALGRCSVYSQAIAIRSNTSSDLPPGTVVDNHGDLLWITCGTRGALVGLKDPRINLAGVTFSPDVSSVLGKFLLRPGLQFVV